MEPTQRSALMLGPFLILAIASVALAADALSNEDALESTLSQVLPANAAITRLKSTSNEIRVVGRAEAHEQVSAFMRGLATLARTRHGLGKVVDRMKDGAVRVSLFGAGRDVLLELSAAEARTFDVELMRSVSTRGGIEFELRLR